MSDNETPSIAFAPRPIDKNSGVRSNMKSFLDFDLRAAGIVLAILGMAMLLWLQKYFVTLERYDRDQASMTQILNDIRAGQNESRQDIKTLLQKRKDNF